MGTATPKTCAALRAEAMVHVRTLYQPVRLLATQFVCRQCGLAKAPEEFRRRFAGRETRIHQCRSCHAEAERLRRGLKRSKARRQAVNGQLARLKRAKSARQVVAVCDAMVRGFGGINAFTRSWQALLERDLHGGGFAALRHIDAILRLIRHCEALRPDFSRWSEEELLAFTAAEGNAVHGDLR